MSQCADPSLHAAHDGQLRELAEPSLGADCAGCAAVENGDGCATGSGFVSAKAVPKN